MEKSCLDRYEENTFFFACVYSCGFLKFYVLCCAAVGVPGWTFCRHLCWRSDLGSTLHFGGKKNSHFLLLGKTIQYNYVKMIQHPISTLLVLQRITEIAGAVVSFDPKPIPVSFLVHNSIYIYIYINWANNFYLLLFLQGDWNGAGAHCNYR